MNVLQLRDTLTNPEDRIRFDRIADACGFDAEDPVGRLRTRRALVALVSLARSGDDELVAMLCELITIARLSYFDTVLSDCRVATLLELEGIPDELAPLEDPDVIADPAGAIDDVLWHSATNYGPFGATS